MDGAAGPSGLDSVSWKRFCTSSKGASTDLCESIVATAKRIFSKLLMEGKVRAALQLVTQTNGCGSLPLNNLANSNDPTSAQTVRDILCQKHPPKQRLKKSTIIIPDIPLVEPHPVLFDEINAQVIKSTILKMDGAAGPSGLDSVSWKHFCTSSKGASTDLCESIVATAKRLCTCYVDPSGLSAFVVCRLIALDKCPGVRPIGIGENV